MLQDNKNFDSIYNSSMHENSFLSNKQNLNVPAGNIYSHSYSINSSQKNLNAGNSHSIDENKQNNHINILSKKKNLFSYKHGIIEVTCNVIGTAGFVIGSALWVAGIITEGALIFAAACIFCGISCTMYACKFYKADDYFGFFALFQQALGCLIFTIASIVSTYKFADGIAVCLSFLTASYLFLAGCSLTQVQWRTWTGVLAPLFFFQNQNEWIPTSLLNTFGSVCFVIGSFGLFYVGLGETLGAWFYLLGSVVFFFASWGDMTIWSKLGLTQTEHPYVIETQQEKYSIIKYQ